MSSTQVIRSLSSWASDVSLTSLDVYAFGSTVNFDGKQFDRQASDLDVLVISNDFSADPILRIATAEALLDKKIELEITLMRLLQRANASTPIASVILAAPEEIQFNIHKTTPEGFFARSHFLNIRTGDKAPFDDKKFLKFDRNHARGALICIAAAQGHRNSFLAVSANETMTSVSWDSASEPLPKVLLRIAAQLRFCIKTADDVTEFDMNRGLEFCTELLERNAERHVSCAELRDWLSVRRGGRGDRTPLSRRAHLLFYELLYQDAMDWILGQMRTPASFAPDAGPRAPSLDKHQTPPRSSRSLVRRQFLADRIIRAIDLEKVCWLHGIHGIGKTTLARQAIELSEVFALQEMTIDCRGEVHAHDTLADSLLFAFGVEPPKDKRVAFRELKRLVEHLCDSTLLVLDELDAFSPSAASSALDLILSSSLRTIIISAQPPETFDRRSTSSSPPSGFVEVFPFEEEESLSYLQQRGVTASLVVPIQRLSGGNPTLLAILTDMAIDVGRVDPIFGPHGRVFWSSIQSYFKMLWGSFPKSAQAEIIVRSTLLAHYQTQTLFWSKHEEMLRSLITSLRHVNIVCPLFMAWAIRECAAQFPRENERRKKIFGLPPQAWAEAIQYLQQKSEESIVSSIVEATGGPGEDRRSCVRE